MGVGLFFGFYIVLSFKCNPFFTQAMVPRTHTARTECGLTMLCLSIPRQSRAAGRPELILDIGIFVTNQACWTRDISLQVFAALNLC